MIQLFFCIKQVRLLNFDVYAYRQHKSGSASRDTQEPNDLVNMIRRWIKRVGAADFPNKEAVLGRIAFEYCICMRYN